MPDNIFATHLINLSAVMSGEVHVNQRVADASADAKQRVNELSVTQLMNQATDLQQAGRLQDCALLYEKWLTDADSPHRHIVCFNWGVVLGSLNQHRQAETAYRQALAISPGFAQARLNLGHQLEQLGEIDNALEQWRHVDDLAKDSAETVPLDLHLHAINNQARLLEQERRLDQAQACMVRSLKLKADQPDVIQHYIHIRQKQCEWPVYQTVGAVTENQLMVNTSALATLSASDDPTLQLLAAQRFVSAKYPATEAAPLFDPQRVPGSRLKIGYLSGDFCLHAMGLLIPELLERHDRTRFEVFGYCFSREDQTPQRQRLIDAMDHHIRIHNLDDASAAQLIASHGIDVLIDLHGLSSGARPRILAQRPAPIQIGYLGLPATSALPGVDYMIADDYVMPPDTYRYYTERALVLPTCYQVSDTRRTVAPIPSRASVGLPEDAFVYCAFNNNHKFSEQVFSAWMEILSAVPNSVLWLLADNEWAQNNMLCCADQHGVERSRLIFAPRVAPAEYLARFAVADLFLDTFPYNAGATASDVLWMGTPLLTRSGKTYISRMAGSLLTAVGLPDLITDSLDSYRELAITLGHKPQRVASYKRYLAEHGRESALFDMPALVKDLEAGVEGLVRQYRLTTARPKEATA